jgi:hypothetical protein
MPSKQVEHILVPLAEILLVQISIFQFVELVVLEDLNADFATFEFLRSECPNKQVIMELVAFVLHEDLLLVVVLLFNIITIAGHGKFGKLFVC